ncbi:MAG: hypothetical protein HOP19_15135, partial [Acidobacteria bacterium]|nr:hypothetical protein [Acidobacteriota bacterium]
MFSHRTLFIALTGCLFVAAFAQTGQWRWLNPRPQGNALYAIRFSDAQRGLALGRDGVILRTENGGVGWQV